STPALNQQARVDILRAGADPFSVAAADVLLNAFQTRTTDPLVSGYTTFTVNVGALISSMGGQTIRLRFAETANVAECQFGVDDVRLVPVPGASALVLYGVGGGLALAYALVRRRRARAAPPDGPAGR